MKKNFVLACLFFASSIEAKMIENEKFHQLNCQQLTESKIFENLNESFVQASKHLPIRNFGFRWGAYSLASCWSLSRLQRLYFYLNEDVQISQQQLADVIRGSSPYESEAGHWKEWKTELSVVPNYNSFSWQALQRGFVQSGEMGGSLHRDTLSEIQRYQVTRFHDLDNLKYLKGPLARTPDENQSSFAEIQTMLAKHELPLLLLRVHNYSQHVLVAKSISENKITVYDSNNPFNEAEVVFDKNTGYFHAPTVIHGLPYVEDDYMRVGLFVVDNSDLNLIRKTLFKHYQSLCQK